MNGILWVQCVSQVLVWLGFHGHVLSIVNDTHQLAA